MSEQVAVIVWREREQGRGRLWWVARVSVCLPRMYDEAAMAVAVSVEASVAFASNEFGYTVLESEELNETEPPPRDSGEDDPDAAAFLLDSAAAEVKATEAGLALAEVAADWLLGWAGGGLGGGATEAAREASVAALLGVRLSKRRR